MSLKDRIANDTYRVFLRSTDFANSMKVGTNSANAVTVVASLQANEVDNNSGSGISLLSFSHVLYAAYPIGGTIKLNAGQILYIDDVAYKVLDFTDEMGVATIHLKRG